MKYSAVSEVIGLMDDRISGILDMLKDCFTETLTGRDNRLVRHLSLLCAERAQRYQSREFVAEGIRLCGEASRAGIVKALLATESALKRYPDEIYEIASSCGRNIIISESVGEKISEVKAPQGVFCWCNMLDNRDFADKIDSIEPGGRYVVLCSMQDPGNIGTVIRCCDAFGVTAVVLTRDCPDVYSPKLLRSTMGSLFHIPVLIGLDPDGTLDRLKAAGLRLCAAALADKSVPLGAMSFADGEAVVIGNEGRGLPQEIIDRCDCTVKIEMSGRAESLNAASAASILTYRLMEGRNTI